MEQLLARVERPSRYIGGEIGARPKDAAAVEVRFILAFPDVYEVGMSHLGYQLLYGVLNDLPWCAAERIYAPWPDMEEQLRRHGLPLATLETGTPLAAAEAIGFTLQYELAATGVLQMLELAGLPLLAAERGEGTPLIVGGGPGAFHPEPLAPFFDLFFIGEGEQGAVDIVTTIREAKNAKATRAETLARLARLPGVYVPAYRRPLHDAGGFAGFELTPGEPERIERRVILDLETAPIPRQPLVPHTPPVHDRLAVEVMRGCQRGCRFCQAGYLYRPVRERSSDRVIALIRQGLTSTGYDEVSLLSLSTGDWTPVLATLPPLMDELSPRRVALSLPSLRAESLTETVAVAIRQVRRTGFTIAPEAATERLRRVINKPIDDEMVLASAARVFAAGWELLKLYFMIGLPTETVADVEAIPDLVRRVLAKGRAVTGRARVNVTISVFVPKPHTPFERFGMAAAEDLREKIEILRNARLRGVELKIHEWRQSQVESAIARGDRRLAAVIAAAYRHGARFDAWREHFCYERWQQAFAETDLDLETEATKEFAEGQALPWEFVHPGVERAFLENERRRALAGEITPDCRAEGCRECGVCDGDRQVRLAGEVARSISPRPATVYQAPDTKIRYWFNYEKSGPAKWLAHLELVRVMALAARRAEIPMVYSEGFHPLPRLNFGPPLALGVAGDDEWMELLLAEPREPEQLAAALNAALPAGLRIHRVHRAAPQLPSLFTAVKGWLWEADLSALGDPEMLALRVAAFMAAERRPVAVVKKSKEKTIDARALASAAEVRDGRLFLEVKHLESGGLRPARLIAEILDLTEEAVPPQTIIRRRTRLMLDV